MPENKDPLELLIQKHLSKHYPQEPDAPQLAQSLIDSVQSLTRDDFLGLLGEAYRSFYRQSSLPLHHVSKPKGCDLYVERWRPYKLLLLLTQISPSEEVRQILPQLPQEGQGPPSRLFSETYKFYRKHSVTQDGKTFVETYSRLFFQPESVEALPEDPARESHDVQNSWR